MDWTADASEQAALVRARHLTATEQVDAAIERIERHDGRINAVIHRTFDTARTQSRPGGAFTGVPMLVKDLVCHTAGDPYHAGMQFLRDHAWTEPDDSHLASRFRRAGFAIVGRTNTAELGTAYTTEPTAYGPTRNPWDLDHSTGGSSGGSAAAVAAGYVAVAHGNDMGGSIRVPASMCGVVGLKPTRARTSLGPRHGEYWAMLAHEGVITRTVRDTAAVLDAVAGRMPGDPATAPPHPRSFADEVGAPPGRLRIGVQTTVPIEGHQAHPDCVTAVHTVGMLLAELGHHVEVVTVDALGDPGMGDALGVLISVSVRRELDRWSQRLGIAIGPGDIEPRNWLLGERGQAVRATDYVAAIDYLHAYARRVAAYWALGFDLLLTPTVPQPPPLLGELPREPMPSQASYLGRFTCPFNVTGQPAISLPLHWNTDALPTGVQLVADYAREDLLLRIAAQLESALPWAHRKPPHGP